MKRSITRLAAMACALLLIAGSFAGCKAKDKSENTLKIAVFDGGYGREVWDKIAKSFESQNEGLKVDITSNPKLGDVIRPKIMSGTDAPDFIYLAATNDSGILQSLIKDKGLEDITDVFDQTMKDKMLPGSLTGPTITPYGDGKIYSAPLFYNCMGLWYNKKLFSDNGWQVPQTWDEFFALGDKAKAKGIALFTYQAANAPTYNESVIFPSIANAGGAKALEDCFNYVDGAWESDAVKKTFEIYDRIAKGGYLMSGTVALNHTQAQTEFLNNKALFIPCGSWLENEMKDTPKAEGFEYGFAALPSFGNEKFVWTGIEEMYIPSKAHNKDMAKKFIKFLYEDESIALLAEYAKGIPPVKGAVEKIKPYVDASAYDSFKIAENGYQTVSGGFATTEQTEVNIKDTLFNNVNSLMNGKITVNDWMNAMETDSDKLRPLMLK